MTLKLRFSLFLVLSLIFVVLSNLIAFRVTTLRYFEHYRLEVNALSAEKNLRLLAQVLESTGSIQPGSVVQEYQGIIEDLSHIDQALSKVETQLPLTSSRDILRAPILASADDDSGALQLFQSVLTSRQALFDSGFLSADTPESHLVRRILRDLTIFNLLLLALCFSGGVYLFRRSFAPIHHLRSQVERAAHTKEYCYIPYPYKDEFFPLVHAINRLMGTLGQQEGTQNRMMSDLSHEIRTPLMAMQCLCEGMIDGVVPISTEEIEQLLSEVGRLQLLAQQILQYQSLDGDLGKPQNLEVIDLSVFFAQVSHYYREALRLHNQVIIVQCSAQDLLVIDPVHLERLTHNIVTNFLKYAGSQTSLSISFIQKDGESCLVFEDDGVGVKQSDQEKLHEQFYRVSVDRQREYGAALSGAGLGLSLVSRLMSHYKGYMSLEKNDTHSGLRVILAFPR